MPPPPPGWLGAHQSPFPADRSLLAARRCAPSAHGRRARRGFGRSHGSVCPRAWLANRRRTRAWLALTAAVGRASYPERGDTGRARRMGQSVFITGGAGGFGVAFARLFLGQGLNVALADV